MRVDDLFPPEVIDEDIRKWMGGAALAGALAAAPLGLGNHSQTDQLKPDAGPPAKQVALLAQTIWGEARDQGDKGMLAVGYVIKNRAESGMKMFGSGLAGVILKNKQFSSWNAGDPNLDGMKKMQQIDRIFYTREAPNGVPFDQWLVKFKQTGEYLDYVKWREAFKLSKAILTGSVQDPTHGATYYHTKAVHPAWAKGMQKVGAVNDHIFYRMPDKTTKS